MPKISDIHIKNYVEAQNIGNETSPVEKRISLSFLQKT